MAKLYEVGALFGVTSLRKRALAASAAVCAALCALPAAADTGLQDLCTDRPTKSTSPCTVDAGAWQIETDILNYSNLNQDGLKTETLLVTDPTVKWGLTSTSDLELTFTPYEIVWQSTSKGRSSVSGFGDLYFRYKTAIVQNADNSFAFTLDPYIKVPTASAGLGNGAVEGGVVAPMTFAIPLGLTLTADPEVDILKDGDGSGYHANASALLNLSRTIEGDVSGAVELWGSEDFDPAQTTRQASLDFALVWLARRELQFDVGLNIGLTQETPGFQEYFGVSTKF